jgi:hypothetical protein
MSTRRSASSSGVTTNANGSPIIAETSRPKLSRATPSHGAFPRYWGTLCRGSCMPEGNVGVGHGWSGHKEQCDFALHERLWLPLNSVYEDRHACARQPPTQPSGSDSEGPVSRTVEDLEDRGTAATGLLNGATRTSSSASLLPALAMLWPWQRGHKSPIRPSDQMRAQRDAKRDERAHRSRLSSHRKPTKKGPGKDGHRPHSKCSKCSKVHNLLPLKAIDLIPTSDPHPPVGANERTVRLGSRARGVPAAAAAAAAAVTSGPTTDNKGPRPQGLISAAPSRRPTQN